MPIKFAVEKDNLMLFRISGRLGKAEFDRALTECEEIIQKTGNMKILVLTENFKGWEKAEGWGDISFSERNDPYIDKIAIVGEGKWRDLIYAFTGKWFRQIPIKYFEQGQDSAACQWLDNPAK